VGRKVALRTAAPIAGRKKFRGELVAVGERSLRLVAADKDEPVEIPYEAIVRGNVLEEGTG
jgi:ribosome maturation factor RimP